MDSVFCSSHDHTDLGVGLGDQHEGFGMFNNDSAKNSVQSSRGSSNSSNSCNGMGSKIEYVDQNDALWNLMFEALLQIGKQRGNYNIPLDYSIGLADGTIMKIGLWLNKQRSLKASNSLSKPKLDRMQSLIDTGRFNWDSVKEDKVIDPDQKWDDYLICLMQYGDTFGHYNVPSDHVTTLPDGTQAYLGQWLAEQKERLLNGSLPGPKEESLRGIIPNTFQFGNQATSNSSQSLTDVSQSSQVARKGCKGKNIDNWMIYFDALNKYCEQYGTCNVPYKVIYQLVDGTPVRLGRWIDKQRQYYRKNRLKPARQELLQDLVNKGRLKWRLFGTETVDDTRSWEMRYNSLVNYAKENNNCDISHNYFVKIDKETIKLGQWLTSQRQLKRSGKLPSEHEKQLQALVDQGLMNWDIAITSSDFKEKNDKKWMRYFEALMRYGKEYNTCNIPQAKEYSLVDGTNVKLGMWLNKQRKDRKKGIMPPKRENRLQELVDRGLLEWDMMSAYRQKGTGTATANNTQT